MQSKALQKREKKMHLYFLEFAGFKVSEEGGCYIQFVARCNINEGSKQC